MENQIHRTEGEGDKHAILGTLYFDDWAEQRRISALGWRTSYLDAQTKNVLSHRAVEERRILQRGQRTSYLAVYWLRTSRKSAEIRRS